MTITYPNGTAVEALLMARTNDTLRAAVSGDDDARTFTRVNGTWISENGERVTIEFAWQRGKTRDVPTQSECVCSRKLASQLIPMLLAGSEGDDVLENMLYVFSTESRGVRIQKRRLEVSRAALTQSGDSGLPN